MMQTADRIQPIISSRAVKNKPVIEVSDLSIAFGKNRVLDHFNLALYKGESLAVLGKSGSGKSVLIKCIIGLLKPLSLIHICLPLYHNPPIVDWKRPRDD